MRTVAEVRLWGRTIGAVSQDDTENFASFEYDSTFAGSGIELSPIKMPLSKQVYFFPDLSQKSFHGLPGMLADSLPDRFGNDLINAWLAAQGRDPDSFIGIERLCYIGKRGMGALEYAPAKGPVARRAHQIKISKLVELASEILTHRGNLKTSFQGRDKDQALKNILRVGTSAGGARAKAVIAWNPASNEVRSGQLPAGDDFEYWIMKFDGVNGNKDKESEDPKGYGLIEYAYFKMAIDAGITMNKCKLFQENGRNHFMTKRFDRLTGGEKLHMQSLGALAHFDFNKAGNHSYEQALFIIKQLNLPMNSVEEMFRRMAFNIIARNQDDHVKNIAFLMDKSGNWSLAPAYDVTYSYNHSGTWTDRHQMTMNGKRDNFTMEDFKACAKTASMKRGRAETILGEIQAVIRKWMDYAEEVGVPNTWATQIQNNLRLGKFPKQ